MNPARILRVGTGGALGLVVALPVIGSHRIEPRIEMRVRDLDAARERCVHDAGLDEARCEKDVVSTSGAGRARRERRTLCTQSTREVRRYRRGHELRDDGGGHASHPRISRAFPQSRGGLRHPPRHSGDDREPFGLDARLREGGARGFESQACGATHEAPLLLAEPERRRVEIAGIKADDLAPATILHGRLVDRERSVVARAKIRRNTLENHRQSGSIPPLREDDLSLMSCHIPR